MDDSTCPGTSEGWAAVGRKNAKLVPENDIMYNKL